MTRCFCGRTAGHNFLLTYILFVLTICAIVSKGDSWHDQQRLECDREKVDVVHVATLIVSNSTTNETSSRHETEKAQLLKALRKGFGTKRSSHPRHRLLTALYGYVSYGQAASAEIDRFKNLYANVPKKHRSLLNTAVKYDKTFDTAQELIRKNAIVCENMVQVALQYYHVPRQELDSFAQQQQKEGKSPDRMAVSQAIKLFVRDWSAEGAFERKDTLPCLLKTIDKYIRDATTHAAKHPVKILVPGAGLGRLAHEIALQFPASLVTSNEWSYFVNVAYRYFESLIVTRQFAIHPYIESWSHLRTRTEAERQVLIPDIVPRLSNVLLVEGDFTRVFDSKQSGAYDFIVTLFFIDTARNLVSYLETIHRLLRPGGIWINLGPLLYGSAPFVQLSLDEIVEVIKHMGFQFEPVDDACGLPSSQAEDLIRGKEALYNFNGSALNKFAYEAQSWAARKL